jgi:predicted DNA-binding protein
MVRTQIRITEEQAARLRTISAERGQPVAELIRRSIDSFLQQQEAGAEREQRLARAKSAVGRFASSLQAVGVEHDHYLAETFGRQ